MNQPLNSLPGPQQALPNDLRSSILEYRRENEARLHPGLQRERERPDAIAEPLGACDPPGDLIHVASNSSQRPAVTLTCASTLKPEPVNWLWRDWLALGKTHILGGQPGAGKTTLAVAVAAIVTKGGRWPDGSLAPLGNVVIWSGEDDPADTLLPRLLASGADANRVYFVGDVIQNGERRSFDPAKDMPALREAIEKAGGCNLLIVDPLVSAVAADSHKNADTRRALQPLVDLAASINAALLGITHLSKGTAGREPIERITGSIAFGALARVVLIAAKEAEGDGETQPRRFLARAKSNIGPDDGGFAYELRQEPMPGDERIIASIAVFGDVIEGNARDMLATAEANTDGDGGSALREAKDFLLDFLAEGPRPAKETQKAGGDAGHSRITLRRAKDALGVIATKAGMGGGWEWALPEDAHQTPKMLTPKTVSTFANDEHLRGDDGGVDL